METVPVTMPKADLSEEFTVETACVLSSSGRVSEIMRVTDGVRILDLETGAMSINGHEFKTTLFGEGINIKVTGADTVDPALYINNELALEGCGVLMILDSIMEILRLECANQDEYPS